MKRKIVTSLSAFGLVLLSWSAVHASSFADMPVSEVSGLLASAPVVVNSVRQGSRLPARAEVDASDMMSKVYGIVPDKSCRRADCVALNAQEDEGYLWLDSADGYCLSYEGMTPDVSAAARIDDTDRVDEYCYFFLFPYSSAGKEEVVKQQAQFTGTLLQDMSDHCRRIGSDPNAPDIFAAAGEYGDNAVTVRLIDEAADGTTAADGSQAGRYILMLIVEPGAGAVALGE